MSVREKVVAWVVYLAVASVIAVGLSRVAAWVAPAAPTWAHWTAGVVTSYLGLVLLNVVIHLAWRAAQVRCPSCRGFLELVLTVARVSVGATGAIEYLRCPSCRARWKKSGDAAPVAVEAREWGEQVRARGMDLDQEPIA